MKSFLFLFSLGLATLCLGLPANTTLDGLSKARMQVKQSLDTVTRQFEVALNGGATGGPPGNSQEIFKTILEHSKVLAHNITILQVDYASVLGAVDSYFAGNHSLSRKMVFKMELVQLNAYERQLVTIQKEVLALMYLESGSYRHPHYVPSEKLVITANLLIEKLLDTGKPIEQVDTIFDQAKKGGYPEELPMHLPAASKAKVIKLLQEFAASSLAVLKENEVEYYSEVERLRLHGQKLTLEVQTIFETTFDVIYAEITTANNIVQQLEKHGKLNFLF